MTSSSPGGENKFFLLLLLLVSAAAAAATFDASPSCNPMVCACHPGDLLANCSRRGFLVMPAGLPSALAHLDLSSNDLEVVNVTEVSRLTALVTLDLSDNKLSAVAFTSVHSSLKTLDLSANNISSVRSLQLAGLVALETLDLSLNKLISLPANAFEGSASLRTLYLRGNRIVSLETGSLDGLTSLRELVLTKNRLSSFPKGLFQHLKSLEVLELNRNKFVEVQGLSFHGLQNLRVLRLKRNDIEFLMDGAFYGLDKIEELHLDRNQVAVVEKGWLYGLYTLRTLSLAFNRVEYVTEDGWEFCRQLDTLDLRSNRLQLLDRDSLRMLPRLRHLFLQDNQISHVRDDDTFAEVPLLETLALDGNEISHTIEDMDAPFRGLAHLTKLTLSRNQIKSIGARAFLGGLDRLEEVDVTGNAISTVQENAFAHLPNIRTVRVDSASMLCDCYLKWFPLWLNATGGLGGGCAAAVCAHPETLKGRNVTAIGYEQFTCDDFPKPYILQQPQTQITLVGDNLTLFCRAASTSPAEMRFQWKVDSETLDERSVKNVDHSFDGKGRDVTSQLQLVNVTHEDAGRYQCVVSNTYGATYSDRANVTVYVFPRFLVTPEDITVRGGSTAALKCAATGVPAPKVSWSKDSGSDFPAAAERRIAVSSFSDGGDARTNINSFVIYGVKAVDMGVYQCTAANPAGSISWNISLSVLEVPRFVKPMEGKAVAAGDTAVIECMASGSPRPRLTWTKDGRRLDGTEERHFFTADNQLLIIVKARREDSGRYECTMHNQLGTESQTSLLEVTTTNLTSANGGGAVRNGVLLTGDVATSSPSSDPTTGIIIIAVVCCIVGTSLVWVFIIYKTRQRRNRMRAGTGGNAFDPDWKVNAANSSTLTGGSRGHLVRQMDLSSLPGAGEFDIDEHVRRGLLSGGRSSSSQTHLDRSTGLLTTDLRLLASSAGVGNDSDERDSGTGDSKKSNDVNTDTEEIHAPQETDALLVEDDELRENGAGECAISLSEFELDPADNIPFADDDDESNTSANNHQGGGEGQCNVSLTTSSSVGCNGASKEPEVQFRTFHPTRGHRQSSEVLSALPADLKVSKKRASAVELNGECYLAIEPEVGRSAANVSAVEPAVYRGGVGSLPRSGMLLDYQQRLLEATLASNDCLEEDADRANKGRKRSIFLGGRNRQQRSLSRGRRRRKSGGSNNGDGCEEEDKRDLRREHSSVGLKAKEMFG